MVEFHSSHPKFFRCGDTFNFEVVSSLKRTIILAVFAFEQSHNKLRGSTILMIFLISCKPLTLFESSASTC